ncbi:MAG: DNA-3-methyladenine glycosylase [Bacteroidales bacterium]
MQEEKRIARDFFTRDVLVVAPALLSKTLAIRFDDIIRRFTITETEAYRGEEDKACHAWKGRTPRTEIMYHEGGRLYIYLVYGMHWMLNIVTGEENNPQAVLIRGIENCKGPGRVTKVLGIDRTFYGEDLTVSDRIWLEGSGIPAGIQTGSRIGIDYAGEYWKSRPWRYFLTC